MDDRYYYEQEEAQDKFLEEISLEKARDYLGLYGDAIQDRILACIEESKRLEVNLFYDSAVVSAFTAVELLIRFMLIKPLVQSAFHSEEWADILAERIGSGRTDEDRKLLPKLLKVWRIDIDSITLSNGHKLWEIINNRIRNRRNKIVHIGEKADLLDAKLCIECAETMMEKVVGAVSKKLGFTIQATGKWSVIKKGKGVLDNPWVRTWVPSQPPQFKK